MVMISHASSVAKKNNNHFCFYSHYSRRHIKKDIAVIYVSVVPMFSSKSFIISGLIFISLIHLEFIFVYGVKKRSMFIFFLTCSCPVSPVPFIEETVFSPLHSLASFVIDHRCMSVVFQVALVVKNPPASAEDLKRLRFDPWVGKIPWRRAWQPTQVFLPGESHRQRSLVGYHPWDCKRVRHD